MEDTKQKSPFGLKSIHIKDFKGIKNASLEDVPPNTPWIFLTGKNGYGKTCVLQGIFLGWFGNREGKMLLDDGEDFEVEIEGYNLATDGFQQKINRNSIDVKSFINIVAYGSSRINIQSSELSNYQLEAQSGKHYSLFNTDGTLLDIEGRLKNWYYRSFGGVDIKEALKLGLNEKYINTVNILVKLLPTVESIKVHIIKDKVVYKEQNSNNELEFHQLASGNKSIIAMIGDMIIRLFDYHPNITNPSDFEGIVLIDELDLHLHPEWQKKLPQLLSEIFPKVQFIASTHSPIPFLGAPEGSLFIKVNRTVEEGITIEKLNIDIQNLTPNLILSSPIFGFTSIFPITHKEEERIRTEDTMQEVQENDLIDKRLSSFFGSEKEAELKDIFKIEK